MPHKEGLPYSARALYLRLQDRLKRCYHPGFGICPSPPDGNFANQLWVRDFCITAASHYAKHDPAAAIESLSRILKNQRKDGALPYRVVREYGFLHVVVGLGWLARPAFVLIEGLLRRRKELPSFEGQENGAEDTVPAAIIAASAIFAGSKQGEVFVAKHLGALMRAAEYFLRTKTGQDGLAVVTHRNPDWTETIQRTGKLGYVNVLWVRALGLMGYLARRCGDTTSARRYFSLYRPAKKSLLGNVYDPAGHYFRAKVGDDRLDTGATVLGSLFFLPATECQKVEGALFRRVGRTSGLQNFDPPYQPKEVWWLPRLFGNGGYHNEFVWPWLTCVNIAVLLKIAARHSDTKTRFLAQERARVELDRMVRLYTACGGAPEIVEPRELRIAKRTVLYDPPRFFAASCATFCAACDKVGAK